MPLNPQAVAAAFVATPNSAGSAAFGRSGIGLVVNQLNVPIFTKFIAQAGFTYVVSTNVVPGDLVVTGPNGGPLNPGGAIKAFSFTPNQNGLYVVGFVANPRFVVTGQEIDVSIQAFDAGLPTNISAAENVLNDPVGAALRIANGGGVTQYFLHQPDGNPNGIGARQFDVEPSPPDTSVISTDGVTPAPPNHFLVTDQSNDTQSAGVPYSGPLTGLSDDIILAASDNINVVAEEPNVFIRTDRGDDVIDVSKVGGNNVLDGGTGGNLLIGGSGKDSFYLNERNQTNTTWSTIMGFHSGDTATVFGVSPEDFAIKQMDGAQGLTFSFAGGANPAANLTIAGFSTADIANGKLNVSFADDNMVIQAT